MNRWIRWLAISAVLVAGFMFLAPQTAEAGWGRHHCGYRPVVAYYGGWYAPYSVYSPLVAPAYGYGYYTPYTAYHYGYRPYAASFYFGARPYWFGAYGW